MEEKVKAFVNSLVLSLRVPKNFQKCYRERLTEAVTEQFNTFNANIDSYKKALDEAKEKTKLAVVLAIVGYSLLIISVILGIFIY